MPTHLLLRGLSFDLLRGLNFSPDEAVSRLIAARATSVEVAAADITDNLAEKLASTRLGIFLRAEAPSVEYLASARNLARSLKARAIILPCPQAGTMNQESIKKLTDTAEGHPLLFLFSSDGTSPQIAPLIEAVPGLRVALDAEALVDSQQTPEAQGTIASLAPLLDRVDLIYGRCNPDQPEHSEIYKEIWAEAMRRWRRRNPAGSTLTFIPSPMPDSTSDVGLEDRLARCGAIWQMAQAAWKASWR